MINILSLMIGTGLVLTGRRLFWLLVGAIGFLIGVEAASRLHLRSELLTVFAVLVVGLVFALLAVFLESVAIGMAGFLGGGFAAIGLLRLLEVQSGLSIWTAFIVGGILGVILVIWLFNWALITISSITGASMIAASLPLGAAVRPLIFLVVFVLGMIVQAITMAREGGAHPSKKTDGQ